MILATQAQKPDTNNRVARQMSESGFFDNAWYRETYLRGVSGVTDPVSHYVKQGASQGFDPSPYFSSTGYLTQNPDVLESGENPLWHYLMKGRAQGRRVPASTYPGLEFPSASLLNQAAIKLESKLWAGFSGEALALLKAKLHSPQQPDRERASSAWALARWCTFKGDYTKALKYLLQRQFITPRVSLLKAQGLLLADCLTRLCRESDAYELLAQARQKLGQNDPDVLLAKSNVFASAASGEVSSVRLSLINQVLSTAGMAPVALRDSRKPLGIFNIESTVEACPESQQALVSVVMPAFNASDQIELALRSLLAQSWTNIEVLVADDCSSDNTAEVVSQLSAQDSRIQLVPMAHNGGAYAARNGALQWAKGDFITVHDSDDWSHPQKLELQVQHLLSNPKVMANTTDWARAREDLYFTGTFRAHGSLTSENTSSLMFRREVVDALGGWDLVRTSADTEYVARLGAYYGEGTVARLHRGVPLAFALDQETSLTRTPVTHAKTLFYGARREYREAAEAWHKVATPEQLRLPPGEARRPFPIPSVMQAKRSNEPRYYDIVVIADFNLSGGAFVSTMNYVNAALSLGKRVAIFHWRRFDLDVKARLKESVRLQAHEGRFDILAAGEPVEAKLVLVGYPVVLNYRLDALPRIDTRRFLILVNQMASRLTTGGDVQYDPERISSNVRELFDIEPLWVPISGYVKQLMWNDVRYPIPHDDVWNPLLDVDAWCRFRVPWRGGERERPVLGRHSRDHYTKWPATAEALAQAYCVDQACEIKLLGGADHAISVLGRRPDNWEVLEYAETTHEFLQELDFFIHFPHEQYIEEFGRAVLEAMGLGIPVILPPVFRNTFGDYAHYAEPDEVWPLVQGLWRSQEAYDHAADLGLEFVRRYASYSALADRLQRLG